MTMLACSSPIIPHASAQALGLMPRVPLTNRRQRETRATMRCRPHPSYTSRCPEGLQHQTQ